MRLRTSAAAALALGALACASGQALAASTGLITPETLKLDSHAAPSPGYAGPVKTNATFASGRLYVSTVSGVISYYDAKQWTNPRKPWTKVCGTPSNGVTYLSPGVKNGKAGMDAEFVFARPWTGCNQRTLPRHWANFQKLTANGWRHPVLVHGRTAAPTSDHKYDYALKGAGGIMKFRLQDLPNTADNYGQLKIVIRQATSTDCANGGWMAFGSVSEADCDVHAFPPAI